LGGNGGSSNGGAGGGLASITAGVGTGGLGGNGMGGNGGNNTSNAGTFNLSNNISGVAQNAAGIVAISQNTGFSSLVQQSVNVQSNLGVGK
jgi:hypothetical protein